MKYITACMLRTLKRIGAGIALGTSLLLSNPVYSQQNVNIHGTVTGIPNNNNIHAAKVVAVRTDNGARVDSAYTKSNGYYNMDFIWTGTEKHETLEEKIVPNPYSDRTQIIANIEQEGIYTLLITGIDGKTLLNTSVALQPRNNSITLSGGPSGVHLITLVGNDGSKTYKGIQTESTGTPIKYDLAHTDFSSPTLKSGLKDNFLIGDEVRLEFTKNGYYDKDTVFVVAQSQIINQKMQAYSTITGLVTGAPNNNVIQNATVQFINPLTNQILGATVTNNQGIYNYTSSVPLGNSLKIVFSTPNTNPKNSYNSGDTTFTLQSLQTINIALQQIPYTFTCTLKPFLDNGTPITETYPDWNASFTYEQPYVTKTYFPDANNEIHLEESLYPNNGMSNVTIKHDTSYFMVNGIENGVLSWIILRAQNQSTARRNPAQSFLTYDGYTQITTYQDSLITSLDSLDGRVLNYYMLPKKAEVQPGTWFRMDHGMVGGYMLSSGDGLETSKFINIPPYGHVVLMSTVYDNNPNQSPTQANMDRAINEYNKCANLCVMNNNDNIMQPTQFFYTNRNDSIWNAIINRSPAADNVELLTFAQSSPGVGRLWTNTYTYDGEARLSYTKAKYSESATNGQIFEENYSATYGIEEGSGSLGPYVYIGTTGQPTDLAGRMGRWVKILDLGSGNSKK